MEDSRIFHSVQLNATYKLSFNTDQQLVKDAVTQAFQQYAELEVKIENIRFLKDDGIVLILISAPNEGVIREVDGMFPFQSIHLVKKWIHHAGRQSIAILPNPPPRVTPDYVQGILEATEGINAEVSKDGNDIKVILENATDLPYLLSKTFTLKKTPVHFQESEPEEGSMRVIDDELQVDEEVNSYSQVKVVSQEAPPPDNFSSIRSYNRSPVHLYSSSPRVPPSLHVAGGSGKAVEVTSEYGSGNELERQLRGRFNEELYQINEIFVDGATACFTFTSEEGIIALQNKPLGILNGYPIECRIVSLEYFAEFKKRLSEKEVLIIRGLPSNMSEAKVKVSLKRRLSYEGHMMKDCIVKGTEAHITFENDKSVRVLVSNPPDNSELLGHPITYSTGPAPSQKPVDPRPHVVVENLPDIDEIDEDLVSFMNKTTNSSVASCEVKNGTGYLYYHSPEDAKRVVQAPPSSSFYGQKLKVTLKHSESVPGDMSDYKSSLQPLPVQRINTSPAAMKRPVAKPQSFTDLIIVENIPQEEDESHLSMYFYFLCGVKCSISERKGVGAAVIRFDDKIDVKLLKEKSLSCSFGKDQVQLIIESYKPRSSSLNEASHNLTDSIIVSGLSPGSQSWMLKAYLNQFGLKCDDPQMIDGGASAIVKLNTKADVSLLQQSIEISPYPGQRLSVEPYNPPDAYDGAPVTTNKPCSGLSSFIVVKEIPLNTADYSIKLYIDKLHGSEVCMDPQFNPEAGIAVIELKESIDVKELRRKAMKEPFPNGKVVLNIDVLKPSTSVFIESLTADAVPRHVIEMYCEQFGDFGKLDETKGGYIVTFNTRESQQKMFSQSRIHSAGKHQFIVEEYNPLLKPARSPSPPPPIIPSPVIPPPIPPRAVYSWTSYRKTISREARDYYMHYTKEINEKLLEGKLRVSANSLEVEPLAGANDIDDWDVQVRRVIDEYSQNFESAEMKVPAEVQKKAVDYIEGIRNVYPDLYYSFHPPALIKMCGHSATIRKTSTELEKMTQEEIQITLQLEKHPRYIEYILKFAKDDIKSVRPPVKIEYEKERPGCVTVHGVKKSLDKVEDLAEKKIKNAFTETIPLTASANNLLQSRDGRDKISKALGPTEHSVLYVFEKTDTHHDFQAQICILSPESVPCAAAKKRISSLIVEEKLALSLDEAALCTSQEWGNTCARLTVRYFVSINTVANEFVLLTGEDIIMNAVVDEIKQFLHTQNAVTDKLPVKSTVWQIIGDGHKCKEIEKTAKKQKVKLTFPAKAGPGQDEVIIVLKGEAKAVSHVKVQLLMLVEEIKEKRLVIPDKVGLKKLIDNGMVRFHCNGIEANNDVKISFQVEEVSDRLFAPKGGAALANAPHCVIGATSPNGIKIQVYTGDPAMIKRADALALFVCDATTVDDPSMASIAAVGGAEMRIAIEAFTARQRLIDATVHKCATVGNLDYAEVYHVVLPKYSSKSPNLGKIIDASMQALFDKVSSRVRDVIIAPLTGPPHKYPVELCAQSLLNYFSSASFGIYNDISVGIFIEKDRDKMVFHKKLQELTYSVYHFDDSSKRGGGTAGTSLKIQLLNGDVTKAPADVIVNSTSIEMRHDANAISKAIHKAAGDDLKRACQNLRDQGVLLKDGFVVSTPASGLLRCNKIIHAHVPGKPKNRRPTDKETSTLKRVVSNCLTTADEEGESSIAFAAFCLGIGGFTVEESAEPTLEAIKEFALTKPPHLKEVSVYALDKALFPQYRDYFSTYFASDATVTPLDSSKGPDGVSVTLQPVAIPRQRTTTTTIGGSAGQKTFKVSFWIHGTVAEKLSQAEKDVYRFIDDMIVDDMVDLGDMTNLLSQSDRENILKFASDQEVEINFQDRLNRVLVSGEERAVEKVCNDIQRRIMNLNNLLHQLHMFEWLVTNRDGTEEPYKAEQAKQLEVAYQRKEEFVKLEIDGIKCIVNIRMMEETEDISRVTKSVLRRRKEQHDYPETWDLSNIGKDVVTFFDVDELSTEYTSATKRFNETIGSNVIITRVQRIQNPSEYARYQSLKKTWRMLHGKGSVHEKELFHGTKRDKVEPICSTGFNRGYAADSNAARYGKGVYFALNASYSMQDKYSHAEKDGSKCILVCSLLVCKVTRGNEKMKVPPPIPENPHILYDTLVEREQNPTIFVAMKDSQAYPKYLIVFKKA